MKKDDIIEILVELIIPAAVMIVVGVTMMLAFCSAV